jgi:hypothetical protein
MNLVQNGNGTAAAVPQQPDFKCGTAVNPAMPVWMRYLNKTLGYE